MAPEGPPLTGPKLLLRPPTPEDLPTLYAWYLDPELVSPFDRYSMDSFDDLARSVREAPDDPASLAPRFVLEPHGGGPIVGCVGHYSAHPVLTLVDVWYLVGAPRARGAGFGSEAVGLLVDHLFRTTAVERVGATTDVANAASYKLLERLGFRREGTYRSALFHHAAWHDVAVYGITRTEWMTRATPPR
ncbi:MAG: GNAT family N-acetyltransferase [Candidatus Lutacidiplasmatales archaeon]